MRLTDRWIASMFLSAALVVPIGAIAMPTPQDDRERQELEEHQRRYYDQQNRDYHNWNNQEDRMYREWLAERRYNYVDYDRLDPRDQQDYWRWRHQQEKRQRHEEHEEHEHDRR
jgi:hypothetical protein